MTRTIGSTIFSKEKKAKIKTSNAEACLNPRHPY